MAVIKKVLLLLLVHGTFATPLHAAAQSGDLKSLEILLQKPAVIVDVGDPRGLTPLHVAAMKDQPDAVRMLLEHGASVERTDKQGMTPLHFAAVGASGRVMRVLLKHGAIVDVAEPNRGATALHIAASNPAAVDAAKALVEYGASTTHEDMAGDSPEAVAMNMDNEHVMRLFEAAAAGEIDRAQPPNPPQLNMQPPPRDAPPPSPLVPPLSQPSMPQPSTPTPNQPTPPTPSTPSPTPSTPPTPSPSPPSPSTPPTTSTPPTENDSAPTDSCDASSQPTDRPPAASLLTLPSISPDRRRGDALRAADWTSTATSHYDSGMHHEGAPTLG